MEKDQKSKRMASITTTTTATTTAMARAVRLPTVALTNKTQATCILQQHLLTVDDLIERVRQILKCVINLHIDILMLDSNVSQILDEVKLLKADLNECDRLDDIIRTLRDYNGPTIYHEWPFPVAYTGDIEEADLAQNLNSAITK